MPQENLSAPLSMSTSAIPGTFGSSVSGLTAGGHQASQASSKAVQESDLAKRDSLLKALDILFNGADEFRDEKIPGLDLFPEALQDMLALTRNGVASTVNKVSLAPVISASHISQLPLDIKACIEGILNSVNDFHQFSQTEQASTLDMEKELQEHKTGFSANCQALNNNLSNITEELAKNIEGHFQHEGSAAKSHASLAKGSATTAMLGSLSTAGLVALMFDGIGSSFREISALVEFSKQESTNPKEKNIYNAFSACCNSFASKNSNESLIALRNLEAAILDFGPAEEMRENHSVTGPSVSVFLRMITAEPFVKTLIGVNGSALALTAAEHALTKDKEKFSQHTRESASKASLIKDFSGGDAAHHSQNVTAFCDQFDEAIKHIDNELQGIANHESIASSAVSTVRSNSALVIASSLIPGFTGLISREFSGSIDFTQNDRGSRQESKDVLQTRKEMTGADLDKLLSRVSALQERLERCKELGVSAPVVLGISEAITSGSLIASLNVVAGMYSALRELRTLTQSPSIPLQLDDAEKLKAAEYAKSVVDSNQKSAGTLGTAPVSGHLSLPEQLQSVMEKVVLTHRSHRNFLKLEQERNDLDSAGKSTIAFSQQNSTGFLLGSIGILALVALESGIGTEALLGALRYSTEARRLSDGVDKTQSENGSKWNTSFASNATRLSEKSMGSSSVIQTSSRATYLVAESAFSRSVIAALCHSGALKEMMRRLMKQEEENLNPKPGALDSALVSDALMPQLYDNILHVFDEAEANHNPIPGLNGDMASTLGSVTNSSLAAALSTHSALISPFLKSIVAAKEACVIEDGIKNEAVSAKSELSRVISRSLNIIQAFTGNFMHEIQKIENPIHNSTLAQSADSSYTASMVVACGVSLLCEELFEICISRSLTLLDKEKIDKTTKKSSEQSQQETRLSRDAVAEDSGLGQDNSVTHVISALRLTLSHLGVALGNFASEMEGSPDLLKDDLHIHSSQRSMLKSMASSFSQCSISMLTLSGALSNLPASSAGSIEALRELIHSTDHQLVLKPVHSSEQSTKDCGSESTLLTGIGTDCMSSMLTSATKLLLQASVLGLDTTLAIAKIMEILCLHPRPGQALALESQALSEPNGLSRNINDQLQSILIAGSIGSAGISVASKTGQSMATENSILALQAAVNRRIEEIALLEDEEENSSLGLKAFYELLVRLLDGGTEDHNDYKDLIQRFHRGGITLSGYHSDHGGIRSSNRERNTNRLTRNDGFLGCDDASALLNTFINKAFRQESYDSLLDKLKLELMKRGQLSHKSSECWEFIVNKVIDRMKLENSRKGLFHPGDARRNKVNLEGRKNDLLHNWELPKPAEDEIKTPIQSV